MIPALLAPLLTIFPRLESSNLTNTSIPAPEVLDIDPRFRATATQNGAVSFDHETCRDLILNYINTTTPNKTDYTPALDRLIFAPNLGYPQNGNSSYYSGRDNMTITVPACQQLCELPNTIDWYADKGPRLMTWIIPVALLLSNIELSPLDKRRFYTLLQALGNPIDMLWSFIHKLSVRTKLHAQVKSYLSPPSSSTTPSHIQPSDTCTITAVLAAFEELLSPELAAEVDESKFIDILSYLFPDSEQIMNLWKATALELADSRTDEQLRSLFAVILYIIQILSAFVFEIGGGSPNPPGGVIAAALTLTFLIPMVFLSAAIGAFTSRRSCLRIMRRFVEDVRSAKRQAGVMDLSRDDEAVRPLFGRALIVDEPRAAGVSGSTADGPGNERPESWKSYFKDLHWRGGKDTYRPWKMRGRRQRPERQADSTIGSGPPSTAYLSAADDPASTSSGPHPSLPNSTFRVLDYPEQPTQPRKPNTQLGRIFKTSLHHLKSILLSLKSFLIFHKTPIYHLLLATIPVLIGVLSGGGLLFLAAEAGWSCRHILFATLLTAWLASLYLSAVLYTCTILLAPKFSKKTSLRLQKVHWYFCFLKDSILGTAILVFVCLTAAGFFNSCSCWGREIFAHLEGHRTPYVVLNVDSIYIAHNHCEFPGIVSGVVCAQMVWTGFVIWRNWVGYLVLRWGERKRQIIWRELYGRANEEEIEVHGWFGRLWDWTKGLWPRLRNLRW